MDINVIAVFVATVAMFAVGALWYMGPFGKIWGVMHGFDKLSKDEQHAAQAKMGPYYGAQALITLISAWVIAYFLAANPNTPWYVTGFLLWLGLTMPANVSGVIFGGTEGKWMVPKIAIMLGGSLVATLVGAGVIRLFM